MLGWVFFGTLIGLVLVILFDFLDFDLIAYVITAVMEIWQFAVCICYIVLYCKFIWLIHAAPEIGALQFQIHTFFLFMIFILLCKTIFGSLQLFILVLPGGSA